MVFLLFFLSPLSFFFFILIFKIKSNLVSRYFCVLRVSVYILQDTTMKKKKISIIFFIFSSLIQLGNIKLQSVTQSYQGQYGCCYQQLKSLVMRESIVFAQILSVCFIDEGGKEKRNQKYKAILFFCDIFLCFVFCTAIIIIVIIIVIVLVLVMVNDNRNF